uniref:Catechol-O-methyltransferase domain containing 1 n=1 Tax=Hucho hucho TaxID=62062 RepID=A0A4W5QB21_9TELE
MEGTQLKWKEHYGTQLGESFRGGQNSVLASKRVQTLKMLVHISKAKTILEIGMFTGYGALSMAKGLPEDGSLVACELEKIIVKIGSAMDTLKELAAAGEQFGMVFIDVDKNNYINYYKFILDHNLLRLSGVICVDNSLFKAKGVAEELTLKGTGLSLEHNTMIICYNVGISYYTSMYLPADGALLSRKSRGNTVYCKIPGPTNYIICQKNFNVHHILHMKTKNYINDFNIISLD